MSQMTTLQRFANTIRRIYGAKGIQWLEGLNARLAALCCSYQISQLSPIDSMTYHYVASGMIDATPVILKLGVDEQALSREAALLGACEAYGAVRVMAAGPGFVILEQLIPGNSLAEYFPCADLEAVAIVCRLLNRLHQADSSVDGLKPLSELLHILDYDLGIPTDIVHKARRLRDRLLATSDNTVFLHGDLHHDNVLRHRHRWRFIDPHGYQGDRAFDCCAFIKNPIPDLLQQHNPRAIIDERIQAFSKILAIPQQRLQDWFYIHAVLSWAWQLEDTLDASYMASLVKLLQD